MKTATSYIKEKYDCYKGYSEESIREVCHIWCEVIEEAQNDVKKEYEEKLRWIPIDELHNPTIPFLGKDKSGKIELFKVANVFYLKAIDVVEWRSIL